MSGCFLPMSLQEAKKNGWNELDIILVTGDAYIDHPSFGAAIIGRVLESAGFSVGIIAQPNWHSVNDFKKLGRPRLFFGITAGNLDSMVTNYTAACKKRRTDLYSPNGQSGFRPDMASIVYANRCREAFSGIPIILGGLEASLRRFAQYDYWKDRVKHSILLDAKADILIYGNGEKQIIEIAQRLSKGEHISQIHDIPGTVVRVKTAPKDAIYLPSEHEVFTNKTKYAEMFQLLMHTGDKTVIQPIEHGFILQNNRPLYTETDLDSYFQLPFQRKQHPSYQQLIPGFATVQCSLISHRGCMGGCAFCAIYFHEGKQVVSRSPQSILQEAEKICNMDYFHGTIANVGGPTANMYGMKCKINGCSHRMSCLYPKICKNLNVDHGPWIQLLNSVRNLKKIKHVFVESGIRHDLLLADKIEHLEQFCKYYVGGQLKTAPEHSSEKVLSYMQKPSYELHRQFTKKFQEISQKIGKKQYIIPYLMSSHPGSQMKDAIALANEIKKLGHSPQQVQDFTPTPMTLSTCMYYTGIDPRTMKPVYVAKNMKEKKAQRALLNKI
ncbi:MAG: YgiQ family radical SAM protein [Planctomycetes bacterium]|jgi:uncharacterized radical SAM protein YgiQ|nr:YgiQ family radical SAM protein [Planctomycetota bacterium]